MNEVKRFSYTEMRSNFGPSSNMPYLPLLLSSKGKSLSTKALIDSGASVNVIPFSVGLQLGAVWEHQMMRLSLSGNLANVEARGLALEVSIDGFETLTLAFAWAETDNVPMILGQINFFQEFNIYFYRSELAFELQLRTKST